MRRNIREEYFRWLATIQHAHSLAVRVISKQDKEEAGYSSSLSLPNYLFKLNSAAGSQCSLQQVGSFSLLKYKHAQTFSEEYVVTTFVMTPGDAGGWLRGVREVGSLA